MVAYKDVKSRSYRPEDNDHCIIKDFTPDIQEVKDMLGRLRPDGGGDEPEDVAQAVLKVSGLRDERILNAHQHLPYVILLNLLLHY